jgi:ABC-type transport system involved in multi-copper enzyme maturation permease subunit
MRQFITIARNAFMELVRQPVFLLLMTCSTVFSVFLACVPYFGFGEDPKLVKDSVLAIMLLSGLFGAVLSASASVAHEIRSGTALAVLAKPVGRAQFLCAKYVGLFGALLVLTYVNTLSALLASRMAFDAYGNTDTLACWTFSGFVTLGYALGGFTNYFLRRPFVADAVLFVVAMITLAFIAINFIDKEGNWQAFATGVDWRLIPAAILILFALCLLAGLALACSTRFDMMGTLMICSGLFLLGLISDYLFGRRLELSSGLEYALYSVLYTIVPNWQLFWLADALENQRSIPWSYVGQALGYVAGYLGASLAVALLLFEDRELT